MFFDLETTLKTTNHPSWLANDTRAYPKDSGLAAWSGKSKWYSFLPLGEIVSLFCESV